MPCSEDRFTQSLSRIISHEPYIPIHPLKIMPQLRSSKPIPGIMLSEVPDFQYLIQHKFTILLIRRNNKARGRHAEHLLHDIHNGTGKLPQSQLPQFLLHHTHAVPSRTTMAKTFDGPPSLERSGSEHRRAVTSSLFGQERGLVRDVEPSLTVRKDG